MLLLHTGIHLGTMLVILNPAAGAIWPLLLLAAIHLGIDTLKNFISARRRNWVNFLYLADQGLHLLSIAGMAFYIEQSGAVLITLFDPRLAILATGLLLTTYVWFISERILARQDAAYVEEVISQRWSRMAARALLWVGLMLLITPRNLLSIGLNQHSPLAIFFRKVFPAGNSHRSAGRARDIALGPMVNPGSLKLVCKQKGSRNGKTNYFHPGR